MFKTKVERASFKVEVKICTNRDGQGGSGSRDLGRPKCLQQVLLTCSNIKNAYFRLIWSSRRGIYNDHKKDENWKD